MFDETRFYGLIRKYIKDFSMKKIKKQAEDPGSLEGKTDDLLSMVAQDLASKATPLVYEIKNEEKKQSLGLRGLIIHLLSENKLLTSQQLQKKLLKYSSFGVVYVGDDRRYPVVDKQLADLERSEYICITDRKISLAFEPEKLNIEIPISENNVVDLSTQNLGMTVKPRMYKVPVDRSDEWGLRGYPLKYEQRLGFEISTTQKMKLNEALKQVEHLRTRAFFPSYDNKNDFSFEGTIDDLTLQMFRETVGHDKYAGPYISFQSSKSSIALPNDIREKLIEPEFEEVKKQLEELRKDLLRKAQERVEQKIKEQIEGLVIYGGVYIPETGSVFFNRSEIKFVESRFRDDESILDNIKRCKKVASDFAKRGYVDIDNVEELEARFSDEQTPTSYAFKIEVQGPYNNGNCEVLLHVKSDVLPDSDFRKLDRIFGYERTMMEKIIGK